MTGRDDFAEELNPYASSEEPARGEIRPPTPATDWLRDRLSLLACGIGCFAITWGTAILLPWVRHLLFWSWQWWQR